jgi:gluconokinase
LLERNEHVQLVYLKGSYELIWSRMAKRTDHYMKPQMLQSQFEALEEPANGLVVDISMSIDDIVQAILSQVEQKIEPWSSGRDGKKPGTKL